MRAYQVADPGGDDVARVFQPGQPVGFLQPTVCGLLVLLSAGLLLGDVATAANRYWSGTGTWDTTTANWGTTTSGPYTAATWSNSPADTAFFEGSAGTVTLGTGITASGITFSTADYVVTGNTLTLSGTVTNAFAATIGSRVTGSATLIKGGGGVLSLTNASNDFTGEIRAVGGVLAINVIPDGSGRILYNGGVVRYTGSTNTTSDRLLGIGTTPNSAALARLESSGTGAIDMSNTGAVTAGVSAAAGARVQLEGSNTGDNYFRSQIVDLNGIGVGFTKAGGGRWILTNNNTHTGGTTITAGSLAITQAGALGAGAVVMGNSLSSSVLQALNALTIGSGTTITAGNVTTPNVSAGFLNSAGSGTFEIAAKITGANGNVNKRSSSANTVRFSNDTSDYAGTFEMGFGTTEITSVANGGAASSLGAGTTAYRVANNTSSATLRYVGAGSTSTSRAIDWAGTTGGLRLDASGSGTVAYLSTAAVKTGSGNAVLTLGGTNTGANTLAQVVNDSGGTTSLTKEDAGAWTLTGTSGFTGATTVSGGTLVVDGSLTGTSGVTVASGARLGGSGALAAAVSGAGLVSPGNSPGILTAAAADSSGGTDYAFEFTAVGDPTWSNAAASANDVLRLTSGTPFASSLGAGNSVSVYLDVASVAFGDTFRGGFYTDSSSDFLASVLGADVAYYVRDAGGGVSFNGQNYSVLDASFLPGFSGMTVSTVTVPLAGFASGDVTNGVVTQFVVVPEPTGGLLTAAGLATAAVIRRLARRRRLATQRA